jgi:hypothetical protein
MSGELFLKVERKVNDLRRRLKSIPTASRLLDPSLGTSGHPSPVPGHVPQPHGPVMAAGGQACAVG